MDIISNPEGARAFLEPNGKKLIGKIPQGQEVNVIKSSGDWTEITRPWQYDNQTDQATVWVLTVNIAFGSVEPPPSTGSFSAVAAPGNLQMDVDIFDESGTFVRTAHLQNTDAVSLTETVG